MTFPRNAATGDDVFALSPEQIVCGRILQADWTRGARREWPTPDSAICWDAAQELARRYRIRPMLAAAIAEGHWSVPDGVRSALEESAREYFARTSRQLALLPELVNQAANQRLRFVVVKGMALSLWLWGDPFIRESFDLDVFVAPEDFDRTIVLLGEMGFEDTTSRPSLTPRQESILARVFPERKVIHPVTGAVIDVHRALDYNPARRPDGFEEIWAARSYVRFGQHQIPVPGAEHLLRFLVMHASKHLWDRWKWLADLAAVFRRMGAEEILKIRGSATDRHFVEALDCSLLLVSIVGGQAMPAEVRAEIVSNRRTCALARRALEFASIPSLDDGKRPHLVSRSIYLALRSHEPRMVAYELRFLMHTESDWRRLRLPDSMIPIYYLVRIGGFFNRRVRAGRF